jgi:hypothetical protein
MLHCPGCGKELQENAVICGECAHLVQYKTHYSPSENIDAGFEEYPEQTRPKNFISRHIEKIKAAILLLILLLGVVSANVEYSRLQQQHIIQNRWSSSLVLSNIWMDRSSRDDQVIVKGRITNITDRNMQGVVVRAFVLNVVSQSIGEELFQVEPDIILPGESAGFEIRIRCETDLVHQVKIEIFYAEEQREILRPILWS